MEDGGKLLMNIVRKSSSQWLIGLIILAIGIVFLLKNLKLYQWSDSIWKFWPVILIALGFDHLINKPETYIPSQGQIFKGGKKIIAQEDEII